MSGSSAAAGPTDLAAAADVRIEAFRAVLAQTLAERSPERLRAALARGCWVHGAGLYGRRLCELLRGQGLPVLGFVDRRGGAGLDACLELPVVHPDRLPPGQAQGRTLVGGVLNPEAASQDVLTWARSLPFAELVLGADLPDALGEAAMTCWQAPRALIRDNLEAVARTARRLADRASLEAYMGLLLYRVTGDAAHHPTPDTDHPYLPSDLPGFDRPITFVDAGAYTGDTCRRLIELGVAIARYVAFEPDRANFARLGDYVRSAPIAAAVLLPCGLSDRLETVSLEGEGVSCRLVEGGDGGVVCLSLDQSLPGLAPDFVKMDIEGSELAALRGMAETIAGRHPRLAISIYHRPQDLWAIPDWVGAHYDRLYVRQHGAHGFDTVLYAIPDPR